MRKVVAASLLKNQIGQVFDGIITGVTPKGTFVRLFKTPAEGILIRGQSGVDVGDKVQAETGVRGFEPRLHRFRAEIMGVI